MSDLPPLDQQQAWVVVGANEQVGPYTLDLLISEVVAGRLADSTPVWWPALADWTTMAAHPGVAAEIARRRGAPSGAPAWASPTGGPAAGSVPAPATDLSQPNPFADPAGHAQAQAYDTPQDFEPAPTSPSAFDQPSASGVAAATGSVVDTDIADGESDFSTAEPEPVEADAGSTGDDDEFGDLDGLLTSVADGEPSAENGEVTEGRTDEGSVEGHSAAGIDEATRRIYASLVERSSRRAEERSAVEAVDEQFVATVTDAVTESGFGLDDRADVDRGHELRFGESDGNLVVVSLGRVSADRRDQIRSAVVPVTISYRSGSATAAATTSSSAHGDVVITPDEWTGQSTSSAKLFLGVEDYLNDDLTIKVDDLKGDIRAAVAMVGERLS